MAWSLAWLGLLCAAVALALLTWVIPFGHHPTDDGFILGLAHRIHGGQVPHRDFLYVRPPLTPMLHSLWLYLPADWVFFAARVSSYAWHLLVFLVLWLGLGPRRFASAPALLFGGALGLAGLLLAVNTGGSPWHTTDGLLFSVLGLVGLLRFGDLQGPARWLTLVAAGLCFGLAPLAKQNFAAGMVFFGLALLQRHRLRRETWVGLAALALPGLVLGGWLAYHGALQPLQEQMQRASNPRAIYEAGIAPYIYLRAGPLVWLRFLLVPATGVALVLWAQRRPQSSGPFGVALAAFGAAALAFAQPGGWDAALWLWLLCAGLLSADAVLALQRGEASRAWLDVGALLIAWETQISWGFPNPAAGFAAVGLAVALALTRTAVWPRLAWGAALTAAVTASLLASNLYAILHYQYREVPRAAQTADLSAVFRRFGPKLMTGRDNALRYADLGQAYAAMRQRFVDRPVVTVPHFPLLYFLTDTVNATSIDWYLPQEYPGYEQRLKDQLRGCVVLVQMKGQGTGQGTGQGQSQGQGHGQGHRCQNPVANDPLLQWILATGQVVAETPYLCAFVWPTKPTGAATSGK